MATPMTPSTASTTMALVPDVPWSMARTVGPGSGAVRFMAVLNVSPDRRTGGSSAAGADASPMELVLLAMRTTTLVIGIVLALFGLLFTLQGFGAVQGSPMSNTTTWSVLGPIIAIAGLVLAFTSRPRR